MKTKHFLLFLSAIIKAVDEYQDLLRLSVASAGNDHRLGGNEAPPAIISMFIGSDLKKILKCIENDLPYTEEVLNRMDIDVDVLPSFMKDTTDRNRTSPFAFTGNKFEFRMLGSTCNIACPNTILNTIVANSLSDYADILETSNNIDETINQIIKDTMKKHSRIIFNGNNYAEEWVIEAEKRGLSNFKTAVDVLPHYVDEKNIKLFERFNVYTKEELQSRCDILLEEYSKTLNIEALTMIDMAKKDIIPAVCAYIKTLTDTALNKKSLASELDCSLEVSLVKKFLH